MAGRPRLTDEEKKRRGTYRANTSEKVYAKKDNIKKTETDVVLKNDNVLRISEIPPDFLIYKAKIVWTYYCNQFKKFKIDLPLLIDETMFVMLCTSFANYIKINNDILMYDDIDINDKKIASLHIRAHQYYSQVERLCRHFGLSPESRKNVQQNITINDKTKKKSKEDKEREAFEKLLDFN